MKKLVFFIIIITLTGIANTVILINEADADQTGSDSAEFIELFDGGVGNISLTGYIVVLYTGSSDDSYMTIDLTGYATDNNGYFVIGSLGMGTDIELDPGSYGWLQNGEDAIALYQDSASNFPEDTPVTTTNLVDALVYDTSDDDDPELLILLNSGQLQINENENGNKDTESMQRSPNGSGGARNTDTYSMKLPTMGSQNPDPPLFPVISLAFCVSNTEIDIRYNETLSTVSAGDYTLTGTSTITFSGATIDGSNPSLVHLSGASTSMIGDTTLDNISDSNNSSDYDFYAGIMPIAYTNTLNPTRSTILNDYYATFQGRVSADDESRIVSIHDNFGAYNGVVIFDFDFGDEVDLNDEIMVAGYRYVYSNLSELGDPILISSSPSTHYDASVISGSAIDMTIAADTNPAEQWEGQLVKIENVHVESFDGDAYTYTCTDDGSLTNFIIGDNLNFEFENITISIGEDYDVTGLVTYNDDLYKINPRSQSDIEVGTPGPTKLAVTNVNGGVDPFVDTPFDVIVQSQDDDSNPQNVISETQISLSLNTGSGTLGGTITGTIAAGSNQATISGVTYDTVETGVSITVTRTSGDVLTPGNSAPFDVLTELLDFWVVFSVSDDEIHIRYSGGTPAVSAGDYTLTGSATITFSSAVTDGSWIHLSGASSPMAGDLTLDTLTDSANEAEYVFYAGIMPLEYTNTLNPTRATMLNNYYATFQGVVSRDEEFYLVAIHDSADPYHGLVIANYNLGDDVDVDDEILITGFRMEFSDTFTQIFDPFLISSTPSSHFPASLVPGSDINNAMEPDTNPAEQWEGQLIKVENAQVTSYNSQARIYTCTDDGGSTFFTVGDLFNYEYVGITIEVGNIYHITGILTYHMESYILNPVESEDVIYVGAGSLAAPENVIITQDGSDVTVTWDMVIGATSYNIYSDTDPYGTFDTLEANTASTTWSETLPVGVMKFYTITAE